MNVSSSEMEMLRERLAGLTAQQRRHLAKLLAESTPPAPTRPVGFAPAQPLHPPSADGEVAYLASMGQERLWFMQQYAGASPVYNIPRAYHVTGPLDVPRLGRALDGLVQRHAALRTVFAMVDGVVEQRVQAHALFPLTIIDLSDHGTCDRGAATDAALRSAAVAPFDLARGACRALVVRTGPEEHVLLIVMHHIVSDGWSWGNFAKDLSVLYAGGPSSLKPLPVQYPDHAAWQRDQLASGALAEQTRYWTGQFRGHVAPLDLPTDRPRPPTESFRGSQITRPLDAALLDRLRVAARGAGATLSMILLAAYQTLLWRYSGQEDVVVGMPIANRQRVEVEGLIGFFVNTLAMRTSLAGQPTFRELLRRVQAVALDAYTHQDMPLEHLVDMLKLPRAADRAPLFQTVFSLQDFPTEKWELENATVRSWLLPTGTAKFDLSLLVESGPDGWQTSIEYATDLFNPDRIERMHGHWLTLLEAIAVDMDRSITDLPWLTPAEKDQLRVFGTAPATLPEGMSVDRLVAAQAQRTPEAMALVDPDGTGVTYRQLMERAERVASHLQAMGVGPGDIVGLALDRSVELVIGMLAVLRSGAGYWAIEEGLPAIRLRWMLGDAKPRVVLTCSESRSVLAAAGLDTMDPRPMVRVLRECLAFSLVESGCAAPTRVDGPASTDALAYLIYTSGSTGEPKGVLVPHRGVVRLAWNAAYAPIGPSDVVAHAANPAFDASTFEIWGALINGASLVILPREVMLDPVLLADALHRHRVTTLFLTTGLFHQIAELLPTAFSGLGQLIFGGDVASAACIRRLREAGVGARLVNGYGPTETTTFAVCHPVGTLDASESSVPIGRPIAGTTVRVLDGRGFPVPVGVPGEIVIGGPGVALGYLHRPELTEDRFPADPEAAVPGARLYRTGDVGMWRSDGCLLFLGRRDAQVKIRGFRVELGEIESTLRDVPGVDAAAVLYQSNGAGDGVLVAFLVADPGLSDAAILAVLSTRLPTYMLPSRFMRVAVLPHTANGKLDRRALAALVTSERVVTVGAMPRNESERVLAGIFAEVLQLPRVGIDDQFFDIGGHSLAVMQVRARLYERTGVELPVRAFFQNPTVAMLARLIESAPNPGRVVVSPSGLAATAEAGHLVVLQAGAVDKPLLVVMPGGAGGEEELLVFAAMLQQLPQDQPVVAVNMHVRDLKRPLPRTVEARAASLLREILDMAQGRPFHLLGECVAGVLAFEVARQARAGGHAVAGLTLLDGKCPGGSVLRFMWRASGSSPLRLLLAALPMPWHWIPVRRRLWCDVSTLRHLNTLLRYRPKPLTLPVNLILSSSRAGERPADLGWGAWVSDVHRYVVSGTHESYIRAHAAETMAVLSRVLSGSRPSR